jgi:hypothetical protein
MKNKLIKIMLTTLFLIISVPILIFNWNKITSPFPKYEKDECIFDQKTSQVLKIEGPREFIKGEDFGVPVIIIKANNFTGKKAGDKLYIDDRDNYYNKIECEDDSR